MATPDLLAGLADVHLPPVPPTSTPSLVALGALAGAGVALLLLAIRVLRRRHAARCGPLAEAQASLAALAALPAEERRLAEARVLRRYASARLGDGTARLRADAWLARLDRLFASRFFTAGEGRLYGDALYRPLEPEAGSAAGRGLATLFARRRA